MICTDIAAPIFFIFSDAVPSLLYYSHLTSAACALIIGLFVFSSDRSSLVNKLLLGVALSFTALVLMNIIIWTNVHVSLITFIWPLAQVTATLLFLCTAYLYYVFLLKKDVLFTYKALGIGTLFLTALLAYSPYNISYFDLASCEVVGLSTFRLFQNIVYALIFIALISVAVAKMRIHEGNEGRRAARVFSSGVFIFLALFIFTWQIAETYDLFSLEQYGLFGMTIFMAIIAYMIVRFKTFNAKLLASRALVSALWILIGSVLLISQTATAKIVVAITELIAIIFGIALIRSVKREVEQREYLERISKELSAANDQLRILDKQKNEFLSFASHDLKSPIALIKQFATLIYDGTYKEPQKVHETVLKIKNTADRAVNMVNTFLDLRKIEEGRMEYNFEQKNIVEFVGGITSDFALLSKQQKNIDVSFVPNKTDIQATIDTNTLRQVIQNFLDNSLKYTEAGWIKVEVIDEQKTLLIKISDSGLGMDKELLPVLFGQFHRDPGVAKKIQGTGLGLYISKQIVIAHHGDTWAESEGKGKGSQFYIRLPKA